MRRPVVLATSGLSFVVLAFAHNAGTEPALTASAPVGIAAGDDAATPEPTDETNSPDESPSPTDTSPSPEATPTASTSPTPSASATASPTVVTIRAIATWRKTQAAPARTTPARVPTTRRGVPSTTTGGTTTSAAGTTTTSTTSSAPAPTGPKKTWTGAKVTTRWGVVQVRIVVQDERIVAVKALKSPDGDEVSLSINAYALPLLEQQVLSAQSAQIDGVSNATVTSNGYRTSLQSAIDKWHA